LTGLVAKLLTMPDFAASYRLVGVAVGVALTELADSDKGAHVLPPERFGAK
jgi:hypothetical protein